jgi:ABC-type nitrate/sulfonate/bicarbonate transport system substrate-binding protein
LPISSTEKHRLTGESLAMEQRGEHAMVLTPCRRLMLAGAALIMAGLALAPGRAEADGKVRLVLPTPATTYQLPYLVPQDTGWYKAHGIEVEETIVNGDSTALRTVLSGSGDLTIIGPTTVFQAFLEGAKIKYIGSWQPLVDYNIVAAKSITDLAQLADKTMASAGPSDMTTELPRLVMKKHGIATDNVRFVQVGGHAARLQAVIAGKVQGAMVNTLTTQIGLKDGSVNQLVTLSSEFPQLGYVMLTARTDELDDPAKRAVLQTFVEGNIYGARFIEKNPDQAAEILSKRAPDLPIDLVKSVVRQLNAMKIWGVNGGIDPGIVTFTSEASVKWGMIKSEVKPADIADDSLVKAALAKLGTE